jgi:5-methylthioadenosine/S-adenosylhomocysteine deaminase
MTTKFINGYILNEDFEPVKADVLIDGQVIVKIESTIPEEASEVIDLHGNLLMPGFVNMHTHSAMSLFRSLADDLSLQSWLFDKIFPLEAKLTPRDVYYGTQLAILEYWQSGITSFCDMYLFPETIIQASSDLNAKAFVITVGMKTDNLNDQQKVQVYDDFYQQYHTAKLGGSRFGLHAPYTTTATLRETFAETITKNKAPFYIHLSETLFEHNEQIKQTNRTPLQEMIANGLFKHGGGAYHAVWFDDRDIALAKEHNITIVHNPSSNLKLASGIAPILKMQQAGLNIGLGTDGPASNNALDFFREMYLAAVLPKIANGDAAAMDAVEVIKMATINGAKGLGLDNVGLIKVGYRADLIVIDLHQPNMQPINNLVKNLVYAGSKNNVLLTMVDGIIVYRDHHFPDVNVDLIYQECQSIINRITQE